MLFNRNFVILQPQSPDGGIGRRVRLKIWFPKGSAGSIPVPGTKPPFSGGFFIEIRSKLKPAFEIIPFVANHLVAKIILVASVYESSITYPSK